MIKMSDKLRFSLIFALVYFVGVAVCRDCRINSSGSFFDPDNVYQCPDDKVCCMEEQKASCCGDKAVNDQAIDQVKLWGCVLGAAVGVGILICCCRRDSCCNEDANCKYYMTCKCCCGRKSLDDVAYEKFPSTSISSNSIDSGTDNPTQVSQQFRDNVKLVSPANLQTEKTEKLAHHI